MGCEAFWRALRELGGPLGGLEGVRRPSWMSSRDQEALPKVWHLSGSPLEGWE